MQSNRPEDRFPVSPSSFGASSSREVPATRNPWGHDESNDFGGKSARNSLMIVFGVVGIVCFLCCGGLAGLGYLGYSAAQKRFADIEIAPPMTSLETELEEFEASLQQAHQSQPSAAGDFAEVEKYIGEAVQSIDQSENVPASTEAFVLAIDESQQGNSLNTLLKIQIADALDGIIPGPTVLGDYKLLEVSKVEGREAWEADILFYSVDSLSIPARWFFVKDDFGRFVLYDHCDLRFGRRESDIWANYYQALDDLAADGFDEVVDLLNEARVAYSTDNDLEKFLSSVERAKRIRVLRRDRNAKELEIAWAYRDVGEEQSAIEVLHRIANSEARFGAFPSLAYAYAALEDYDQAMVYAQQFETLAPTMPDAAELFAYLFEMQGKYDEAAIRNLEVLTWFPERDDLRARFAHLVSPEVVVRLLDNAAEASSPLQAVADILFNAKSNAENFDVCLRWVEATEDDELAPLKQYASISNLLEQGSAAEAFQALQVWQKDFDADALGELKVDMEYEIFWEPESVVQVLETLDDPASPALEAFLLAFAQFLTANDYYVNLSAYRKGLESVSDVLSQHPLGRLVEFVIEAEIGDRDAFNVCRENTLWLNQHAKASPEFAGELEYLLSHTRRAWIDLAIVLVDIQPVLEIYGDRENVLLELGLGIVEAQQAGLARELSDYIQARDSSRTSDATLALLQSLDAYQAGRNMDADKKLSLAMRLIEQGEEYPDYHLNQINQLRAFWIKASKSLPLPEEIGFANASEVVRLANRMRELAIATGSQPLADWYRTLVEQNREHFDAESEDADLRLCVTEVAMLLFDQDWGSAVQAGERLISSEFWPQSVDIGDAVDELLTAMIRNGDIQQGYDLAERLDVYYELPDDLGYVAEVTLASSSTEEILSLLSEYDEAEVNSWLGEEPQRMKLRQRPSVATELLSKYSPLVFDTFAAQEIHLYRRSPAPWNAANLQEIAASVFGDEGSIIELQANVQSDGQQFVVTADTGIRYIITRRKPTPVRSGVVRLPEGVSEIVVISQIEYGSYGYQALMDLGCALADEETVAVHSDLHASLWMNAAVRPILEEGKLRTNSDSLYLSYAIGVDSEFEDATEQTLQWRSALQAEDVTFPRGAELQIHMLDNSYKLPVNINRVREDGVARVTAEMDLPGEPLIVAGRPFEVQLDMLYPSSSD